MTNHILEKARKLLRLAKRPGTPGEARAAAQALAYMLDKHRLSVAELELSSNVAEPTAMIRGRHPLVVRRKMPAWEALLIRTLCRHYGIAFWRRKQTRAYDPTCREYAICLFGRETDIEIVRFMYTWLYAEALRLSLQECCGMGRVAHNSWRIGFVRGIAEQLSSSRERATQNSAVLALVTRYETACEQMRQQVPVKRHLHDRRWTEHIRALINGRLRGREHHLGKHLPEAS